MLPLQKGRARGRETNGRISGYSCTGGPVTASHIRNNSPDYFPTRLTICQFTRKTRKASPVPSRGAMHSHAICRPRVSHLSFPVFPWFVHFCRESGPPMMHNAPFVLCHTLTNSDQSLGNLIHSHFNEARRFVRDSTILNDF